MVNTLEIEIKGEKVNLLFGNWMCGQMVKEGFDLNTFNPALYENPFLLAPFVIYLAACNANGYSRDAFEESLFLDYCETEEGKKSVSKCLNIFYRSVFGDAFIDEIERLGKLTPEEIALENETKSTDVKKKVTKRK